ncbi:hypothetical protein EJ08DRAFT_108905 [Tothia fuscella]|uniref:Uncharacterized protein n=1 Tax=Tothia fuscella TaxID=1048955 RepID=A0A9P4NUV3_9PEZI|nr:hypothetical protein EJ08DRAFT_108905 [Tothia fuscella]
MVTQEDCPSSNEDGKDRKSLAAAAIRRGEISISEPILWVEGVPDASSAQRIVSSAVPPEETGTSGRKSAGEETQGIAVSTHEEHQPAEPIRESLSPYPKASQRTGKTRESRRAITPVDRPIVQNSSVAETPSPAASNQMRAKKRRQSGSIRTVLRKVFGRRKVSPKRTTPPQSRSGPKHEYSSSDPFPSINQTPESKRDYQPKESLRKHPIEEEEYTAKPRMPPPMLPFPMNINAPDPQNPAQNINSNYISFETSPKVHRRRATLPSLVVSPADAEVLQRMWNSSDLHPPSPNKIVKLNIPSPGIGVALTSGANPNRKSRSVGALHELARAQGESTGSRRRSSEIRFWRESRIDLHDVRRPESKEITDCGSSKASSTSSDHPSLTELSDAFAETGSSVRGGPHSFDFGSITTETNTAERQVHIVEQRLSQLEFNMQHISISLQEIATRPPEREVVTIGKAPLGHRSHNSLGHRSQNSLILDRPGLPSNPRDTKRFTQTSQAPPVHSSSPSPIKRIQQAVSQVSLPSLGATSGAMGFATPAQFPSPRPKTSTGPQQPVIPAAPLSPNVYDHLAPLYNALRYERGVRKALESQVLQLRKDVVELTKVVNHLSGASFTPSPDTNVTREKSRFSGYDSDDENSKSAAGNGMVNPERWATPKEEIAPRPWGRSDGHMF